MKALVIGLGGSFGFETAKALVAHGWELRALYRSEKPLAFDAGAVEWIKGDAMNASDVVTAAEGCEAIVHAANPAGYKKWRELALPMLDSTIAAARATGARVVLPGNVYNFNIEETEQLSETTPFDPIREKGRIRVEMERRLEESGVKTLIVRAGDFFGARAESSWMTAGVLKRDKPLKGITYPGQEGLKHAWAYLPDLAETVARLLDREEELEHFDRFHFRGHTLTGARELVSTLSELSGREVRVGSFPWFALKLIAPFNETFKGLVEMSYLWKNSHELDNRKLVAFLGEEPHTPLDQALAQTLSGLNIDMNAAGSRSSQSPSVA